MTACDRKGLAAVTPSFAVCVTTVVVLDRLLTSTPADLMAESKVSCKEEEKGGRGTSEDTRKEAAAEDA